jgi:AcrR family transcriptional regulator
MPAAGRTLRADARRNRSQIMASARELFAALGQETQMAEIAEHAGVGVGTLYRHFPTKDALLVALVRERYQGLASIALAAEVIPDPMRSLEALVRGYLAAAADDAAFQRALMELDDFEWDGIERDRAALGEVVTRIIDRAAGAGAIRRDTTFADFSMLTCGVLSTMYYQPGGAMDWVRHLEIVVAGLRAGGSGSPEDVAHHPPA